MIRRLTALAMLGFGCGLPASADTWSGYAGLQCHGDVVAIRTGGQWESAEVYWNALPESYAASWKDISFAKDNQCTLANGDKVVLDVGSGRTYATGEGGANPPIFVSLWINGKKVLSRVVTKHGYSQQLHGPFLNSIFISRTTIERCGYPQNAMIPGGENPATVTCKSAPLDLAGIPVDPLQVAPGRTLPRYTFASAYNPDFCASFIRKLSDVSPKTPDEYRDTEIVVPPAEATFPFPGDGARRSGVEVETATLDFWNNGAPLFAVRYWYENSWYDSEDHIFTTYHADAEARAPAFIETLQDPKLRETRDEVGEKVQKNGWSNPMSGFGTHLRIFQLRGSTWVLANADDEDNIIRLIRPGQDTRGYTTFGNRTETVCTFQQRRLNY